MHELFHLIRNELHGAWRYRWLALGVAWVICVLGWVGIYSLPNIYQAGAQVYVDSDSRLAEVMGQVGVSPWVGSRVFVVRQALLGRPQLERLASVTKFDQRAHTPEEVEQMYTDLKANIQISTGRSEQASDLYTISFQDHDREMALAVVQTLLQTFVEDVLEMKKKGTNEVDNYLEDQLTHYSNLLAEAESKLADFKKRYVGLLPGESGGVFEKLQAEMAVLESTQRELQIETDRRSELRNQLQTAEPYLPPDAEAAAGVTLPGSATEARIQDLEKKRSDLLLSFTDRHPDVIALNEQLDQLYKQRDAERAALLKGSGGMEGASNSTNPVYQTAQIALNESNVKIAGLRSQVGQLQGTVKQLKEQINTIPEVEAQLAALTRNYTQYKSLYSEIMLRKERERMGKVGEDEDVVNFNVTVPPTVSLDPVGPKRTLMLVGILIFGLGAGGGLAVLLNKIRPVFHDVVGLRRILDRPVLGQVSMTLLGERLKKRRADIVSFAFATSVLVVLFLGFMVMQGPGVRFVRSVLLHTAA